MTDDISKVYLNTGAATLSPVRRVTASGAECHCQCHKNPNVVHVVPCCRLESTPAEVGPLLDLIGTYWDLAYAEGVQRRNHDTEAGEAQRTLHAIETGVATLARQLAEAKAGMERRGDDMIVPMKLLDEINATSAAWQARAEQAESQLAAATRRLGEVEGLVGKWRECAEDNAARGELIQAGKAVAYTDCADELEAALTKEATK